MSLAGLSRDLLFLTRTKAFCLLKARVMDLTRSVEHVISIPQGQLVSLSSYLETKTALGM